MTPDQERIDRLEGILGRLIGSLARELGMDHAKMLLDDLYQPKAPAALQAAATEAEGRGDE